MQGHAAGVQVSAPRLAFVVHEGRPSWHQARAGHVSAAVTSGFTTREDAEAYRARLAVHHPEIPSWVGKRFEVSK